MEEYGTATAKREHSARSRDGKEAYAGPERRSTAAAPGEVEPLLLTRKYAERIDGIDLSGRQVGQRVCLPPSDARILMAEGWAEPLRPEQRRRSDRSRRQRDR